MHPRSRDQVHHDEHNKSLRIRDAERRVCEKGSQASCTLSQLQTLAHVWWLRTNLQAHTKKVHAHKRTHTHAHAYARTMAWQINFASVRVDAYHDEADVHARQSVDRCCHDSHFERDVRASSLAKLRALHEYACQHAGCEVRRALGGCCRRRSGRCRR